MEIKIRLASEADLDSIMPVYDAARQFMRRNGNLTQWVNGYPSREQILTDIRSNVCYVGVDGEDRIAVVFALIHGDDPTYANIEDGEWLNALPYATIHRIASSGLYGGMMSRCVDFCFRQINNIRVDTHADNRQMNSALSRLGFTRCGIIRIADGSPRTAYQKYQGIQ